MEKFSFAHEVKVLVSDTEIVAGKVIRIKIRATGNKVTFPDIEEIDGVKVLEKSDANNENKAKEKKGEKSSGQQKSQKKKSRKEKLKEHELKRLLKKMEQKGTPTMMYQMGGGNKTKKREDANPW